MSDTQPKTADERLELMLSEFMRDYRSDKRRGFILRILLWVYLIGSTIAFIAFITQGNREPVTASEPHVAKIDILGQIQRKGGVAAHTTIDALTQAFENEKVQAIVLDMDSPGGSAAQSDLIYRELMHLRQQHPETPVYAVIGDVCASGCYYIASAANEIIVNRTSMIGSIGVRMDGFDFTGLMGKLGVERRVLTAGENKVMSDPFLDMNPTVRDHLKNNVLAETHEVFISAVTQGRGEKLVDDDQLFSGLVWIGEEAINKGLADRFGSLQTLLRELDPGLEEINYTQKQVRLLDWITGRAVNLATDLMDPDFADRRFTL